MSQKTELSKNQSKKTENGMYSNISYGAVAGVTALVVSGGSFYYTYDRYSKLNQEIEKLNQELNTIRENQVQIIESLEALMEVVDPEQHNKNEKLYNSVHALNEKIQNNRIETNRMIEESAIKIKQTLAKAVPLRTTNNKRLKISKFVPIIKADQLERIEHSSISEISSDSEEIDLIDDQPLIHQPRHRAVDISQSEEEIIIFDE